MTLIAAAMVLVTYVIVDHATPWLPWHGAAHTAVGDAAVIVSMVLVAAHWSDRPLLRSEPLTGWVNWSFALGFVPLMAAVGGVLAELAVRNVFTVGPTGTYNDTPPATPSSDRWLLWLIPVVGAVIIEELVFRGAMLSILLDATRSPALAVIVSSVGWGLFHGGFVGGYNAAQVSNIAVAGAVAGWGCYRLRSVLPGVAAHLLHNLLAGRSDVRPWTTILGSIALIAAMTMILTFIVAKWRNKPVRY
jgi:membrane protease YdiL (CAAX protease family)